MTVWTGGSLGHDPIGVHGGTGSKHRPAQDAKTQNGQMACEGKQQVALAALIELAIEKREASLSKCRELSAPPSHNMTIARLALESLTDDALARQPVEIDPSDSLVDMTDLLPPDLRGPRGALKH
jgi:hypothetical protein